ncbi:uncharacterized protein LOC134764285 [Penaeus indicus]|uniref:uncharacterized protein LOC134764285 n=1 Tax=Penaeus indicus TaxID=29960 RepID=UPI00300D858D
MLKLLNDLNNCLKRPDWASSKDILVLNQKENIKSGQREVTRKEAKSVLNSPLSPTQQQYNVTLINVHFSVVLHVKSVLCREQLPMLPSPERQKGHMPEISSYERCAASSHPDWSPHAGDGFTCITFQSVDAAFIAARDRHGLPRPGRKPNSNDLSNLATVLLEATRIIAQEYNLPKDVLVNGIPLIDSFKTIVGSICPDFIKPSSCTPKRYREYDGRCNNLENPAWGSSFSSFKRRLPPDYADGIDAPRVGAGGYPLPSPRIVSAHLHRDEGLHDHAVTIMLVAWGQAIDHDLTFTAETKGPRSQINQITSYIDANWVYGSNEDTANRIRLHRGGLMKSLPVFREYGMKDLLPLKLEEPEEGCIRPNNDVYCFDAGDNRVNEQLVLAVVHTMMMREHNRIAIELYRYNPHWDDETLFQESRKIVAASIQHITYNEFLPMVLGKEVMHKYGLILEKHGYFDGYDPSIDASMSSNFVTAAFRFGHSLLPSTIERWSPAHKYVASQRLSFMLRQPYDLYKGGWCDQYIMGLCNQVAQAMDDAVTQEVSSTRCVRDKKEMHPDDIDLWSGGVSERPLPGSMVGPTFSCLIGLTFKELRYGDRFWYENRGGYDSDFTLEQLEEIRKVKLSRIICDNSDDIKTMQVYAMVLPDHEINPRVPCNSGILPRMDLSKWRDPHGPHPRPDTAPPSEHIIPLTIPENTRAHFKSPVGSPSGGKSTSSFSSSSSDPFLPPQLSRPPMLPPPPPPHLPPPGPAPHGKPSVTVIQATSVGPLPMFGPPKPSSEIHFLEAPVLSPKPHSSDPHHGPPPTSYGPPDLPPPPPSLSSGPPNPHPPPSTSYGAPPPPRPSTSYGVPSGGHHHLAPASGPTVHVDFHAPFEYCEGDFKPLPPSGSYGPPPHRPRPFRNRQSPFKQFLGMMGIKG